MNCFLGIDTSNYTTSVSLCCDDGRVVANIRKLLEVKPGERGLRQQDALFQHLRNLPELMERLRNEVPDASVRAVGVSETPRRVEGSYMPVFLAGRVAATSAAASLGVPLYGFSHQEGHIAAAAYGAGCREALGERFLAFHVSGGTTELLLVTRKGPELRAGRLGGTSDLNAGQAIDRTGVALGFGFPAGPHLDSLAIGCKEPPRVGRVSVSGLECSLSGVENRARDMISAGVPEDQIASFVLGYIAMTLRVLTLGARNEYGPLPVLYSGGVTSSAYIRKLLSDIPDAYFSTPEFSADNAAGVAILCRDCFTGV